MPVPEVKHADTPAVIAVVLTDEQREQLEPLFKAASMAANNGTHVMIVAQVYPDGMRVGVIDHERAKVLCKTGARSDSAF